MWKLLLINTQLKLDFLSSRCKPEETEAESVSGHEPPPDLGAWMKTPVCTELQRQQTLKYQNQILGGEIFILVKKNLAWNHKGWRIFQVVLFIRNKTLPTGNGCSLCVSFSPYVSSHTATRGRWSHIFTSYTKTHICELVCPQPQDIKLKQLLKKRGLGRVLTVKDC